MQSMECDKEGVMHGILRLGSMAEHVKRQRMKGWAISFEQDTEAEGVTRSRRSH